MASNTTATQVSDKDQEMLLDEATAVVKEQAFYMRRAIENDNLKETLKHASNMICELRTSLLSPKNYYELYMNIFHELQHLANFFLDKGRHNRKMSDLYDSVQHAGNILPRLYLLITVGACYIKSKDAGAKEILTDMTELCKGVQHPMRGLFLRYYLTQMCKDKLPDAGSEYEFIATNKEGSGTVEDAIEFILTNFAETNRLWVRLQHQGPTRDKTRREHERHDLRVLVGANLVRLSQLDGFDVDTYKDSVLSRILEQVVNCRDLIAQQYLFDCIIQVFPDEWHLQTIVLLLETVTKLQATVDLNPILLTLFSRLVNHNFEGEHGENEDDPLAFLDKPHLKDILNLLDGENRRKATMSIVSRILEGGEQQQRLSNLTSLKRFIEFIESAYSGDATDDG